MGQPARVYGWKRDLPDPRDHLFLVGKPVPLPKKIDKRPLLPLCYDQEQMGSCTANGVAADIEYDLILQGRPAWTPSRRGLYYCTRQDMHATDQDSGASIRDAVKAAVKYGFAPEAMFPYTMDFKEAPPAAYYAAAAKDRVTQYARVGQRLNDIKTCLAKGQLVIFGQTLFESFERASTLATGMVPDPDLANESPLGGHCMVLVGYDDDTRLFLLRNSWGTQVGDKGYFREHYDLILNSDLTSDLWTIIRVP